ncbi:probable inactive receptor-like protein kinase At3g56050 [Rhododendron vialii]|uniref:probable inactive receptor-like protein kinase At3g56050 n=1 Tax=Rhododendron vialii TaxID=182163 RepID=UPI00265EEF58|nr:probable inactive receptor-like protein kinase At3g56050 [Rhododendron vialii]
MIEIWRFTERRSAIFLLVGCVLYQNLSSCWSLNEEGLALSNWNDGFRILDPCSWFGLDCWNTNVLVLNNAKTGSSAPRKLLDKHAPVPPKAAYATLSSPSSSPSPSPSPKSRASSSSPSPSPRSDAPYSSPSPSPTPSTAPTPDASSHSFDSPTTPMPSSTAENTSESSNSNSHRALIICAATVGPMLLFSLVIGIFFCRGNKIVAVRPWATGLSGQLQKAFVTGVPKLKRAELEAACEDFSNVIGSSPIGTVYKGTLSSGVEIAVTSIAVTSAKEWSTNLEAQFRDKINSLSKVNHKNFMNLLGYCEEDEPFTRMLVFEYAPNGTLFEHLHIKEAEHLEWGMRMRITMGIAYCLDHMHQLKRPIAHKNLHSSSVNLTEDYASKVSDFVLLDKVAAAEMDSHPESNVYSFGVVLFEIVTGRLHSGSIEDWASDYLRGDRSLRDMVDPTLKSFQEEQIEQIDEVIKSCVNPNPKRRPQMKDVTARLREITSIGPDGAVPKLSPLWWAELEILSVEGS